MRDPHLPPHPDKTPLYLETPGGAGGDDLGVKDDDVFERKFALLLEGIRTLPDAHRVRLQSLAAETRQRHDRLRGSVKQLQSSLEELRLGIKYTVFDLEATRRENEYLRGLLEGRD